MIMQDQSCLYVAVLMHTSLEIAALQVFKLLFSFISLFCCNVGFFSS